MNPFRAVGATMGCLERVIGWGAGLLFAGVGLRLLFLAPGLDPVWAAVGMAVACLLTAALLVWGVALGRVVRRLGLLWFFYLVGYLVVLAIFLPR